MKTTDIVKANNWPADYVESVERINALVERHGDAELLRMLVAVFEARGTQFAASQVRRAIARVDQGM
jgi:hypothetical protein